MKKQARWEVYQSKGQWYWRLLAPNGKTIADGAEGYTSEHAAKKAVVRVRCYSSAAMTPPDMDKYDAKFAIALQKKLA